MSDDNVTPITRTHTCPSCHLEVAHEARFNIEAHGEECMQPEIRMRRVEHALFELKNAHNQLVDVVTGLLDWKRRQVEEFNADVIALLRVTGERLDRLEQFAIPGGMKPIGETHGTSEASPDTQRSGEPQRCEHGHPIVNGAVECGRCWQYDRHQAADQCGAHADAGAAEPERSPDAGADAAREEPGRT